MSCPVLSCLVLSCLESMSLRKTQKNSTAPAYGRFRIIHRSTSTSPSKPNQKPKNPKTREKKSKMCHFWLPRVSTGRTSSPIFSLCTSADTAWIGIG
ncbi:hypothetical protein BKA61DRAFT_586196 [Leptodontidium sp. MPI-SDFR-AT-0119]|nr:hypothetical protein BKA61DRAFT_586196 [Leptodontidium sp. MPI-SDFR-AT-0119]